jgi:hypothetical protein
MPQIRCPNCGLTINLENRKEIDMNMIKKAVQHSAKSFTELLHITELPRKTLSSRLKELCVNGIIVKDGGSYRLCDSSKSEEIYDTSLNRFHILHDKRVKTGIVLVALFISLPTFSYALASFVTLPQYSPPIILGTFDMVLEVHNVKDMYAWEVLILYNSSELKVLDVKPGDFLEMEFPFFVNLTDINGDGDVEDVLLLASTLYGDVLGKSGDGLLATITFGYYAENYTMPELTLQWEHLESYWINSHGSEIYFDMGSTITLKLKSVAQSQQ